MLENKIMCIVWPLFIHVNENASIINYLYKSVFKSESDKRKQAIV